MSSEGQCHVTGLFILNITQEGDLLTTRYIKLLYIFAKKVWWLEPVLWINRIDILSKNCYIVQQRHIYLLKNAHLTRRKYRDFSSFESSLFLNFLLLSDWNFVGNFGKDNNVLFFETMVSFVVLFITGLVKTN